MMDDGRQIDGPIFNCPIFSILGRVMNDMWIALPGF